MGLWSEWHYTTREIGGWIHIITSPSGRVIICIHTPIPELCNAIQITGQIPLHISLKFVYNVILIWLPAAGFARRWLLRCFESRARAAVALAAILIVCRVFKMRERRHGQTKNEIMNGNQGLKQAKIEFLSHISSISSTLRCRCRAQTYTLETRCHTSNTGGLVWAGRLWISCGGATMCSKCHACMPVCKMYNSCTIYLTPQPCGKPPRSGSAVLLDKNDPVCFSILQKLYKYR